eukprot:m51a1_g7599 hypothetical protein (837) ;mRNA; f:230665-233876
MATEQQSAAATRVAQLQRDICNLYRRELKSSSHINVITAAKDSKFARPQRERIKVSSLPKEYRSNTTKEEVLLDYVEQFRKQLARLYPGRAGVLLCPENEGGVPKFVPTFMRPVKVPFPELQDYKECARFVADHIAFKQLEDLHKPPRRMVSPTTLLSWREGTSYDMSVLLTSLLIGAGYDAYCVSGYAAPDIALMNLSNCECPMLNSLAEARAKDKAASAPAASPYDALLLTRPVLDSSFSKLQAERDRLAQQAKLQQGQAAQDAQAGQAQEQPKYVPRYQHCWVLVKPGKGVEKPLFIEPTRAEVEEAAEKSERFIWVDSVWNHTNVWVNMQKTEELPGSYALGEVDKWDAVLLEERDAAVPRPGTEILKLPPPWVEKPVILEDDFKDRYPNCCSVLKYRRCVQERYSENYLVNGMVVRLIRTQDDQWTTPVEIREYYAKRNDKLERRTRYLDEAGAETKMHELFARGKGAGLREIIVEQNGNTLVFAPPEESIRIDGLLMRQEVTGRKIIEKLSGRTDHLVHRSITFGEAVEHQPDGSVPAEKIGQVITVSPRQSYKVAKITLQFSRNPETVADKDVEKVVYHIAQRKIDLKFHKPLGRIIACTRTYDSEGTATMFLADPHIEKPPARELHDDYVRLVNLKATAITGVQTDTLEATDIMLKREQEEAAVGLCLSVYDTRWRKPGVSELSMPLQDEPEKAETAVDYLRPYLILLKMERKEVVASPELAMLLRRACMASYRARLEAREELIAQRWEQAKVLLVRHEEAYRRTHEGIPNAGHHGPTEAEIAHEKLVAAAKFAIRVLDERLQKIRTQGPAKYEEMHKKLSNELSLPL